MLLPSLQYLFLRDLDKLKTEIESYSDETKLWKIDKNISNSAGNLCLHLIGNLNTYIGRTLGNTNYIRERDLEFSKKNIPKEELLHAIETTKKMIQSTLNKLDETDLEKTYPMEMNYPIKTTYHVLIHLTIHLSYHIGQINFHRRLLDS
ncbi:DinB superfamily protein [Flavobacterium columnare]|nr:DinB superfamily protein [Flavobacterium columnare]